MRTIQQIESEIKELQKELERACIKTADDVGIVVGQTYYYLEQNSKRELILEEFTIEEDTELNKYDAISKDVEHYVSYTDLYASKQTLLEKALQNVKEEQNRLHISLVRLNKDEEVLKGFIN